MNSIIIAFLKARLKEPSTWRGLIAIATGFGIYLSPAMQNLIITVGLILMGATGALTPDTLGKDVPTNVDVISKINEVTKETP
jgi:hypothetical protein